MITFYFLRCHLCGNPDLERQDLEFGRRLVKFYTCDRCNAGFTTPMELPWK